MTAEELKPSFESNNNPEDDSRQVRGKPIWKAEPEKENLTNPLERKNVKC